MKVLMILPPQWIWHRPYLSSPYLSLPSLFAYLKANGIEDIVQKDLNMESYDFMLSKKYLSGLQERLNTRFKALDSKNSLIPGAEQAYYHDLFKAKSSVGQVAGKIETAKKVFRTKDYYDVNMLSSARNTLDQALAIISAAYFPAHPDQRWSTLPPFQGSLEELEEITENRAENPFIELYENIFLPYIIGQSPDIICISIVNHSQLIPALTLSRLIRSSRSKAPIVIGGGVVTLLAEALKNHESLYELFFDIAVLHEGERPLLELAQHIQNNQPLDDVPNLVYRHNGKTQVTRVEPAADINSLPTPNFDGLPLGSYLSPALILPIISSRGCYWGKCAFCANCETYQWRYHKRDEKKVADDMQELCRKYGTSHFAFSDECLSPSSFGKLSNEIIARKMNVRSWAQARLERQFTPDLCSLMARAGFKLLLLGFESGCNRVLDYMKKGVTKETAVQVCRNLHNAGIWNHLYAFFGFPTETRTEAQETVDFLLSNKHIVSSFNIDAFIVGSGSSAKKHPELFGIADVNTGLNDDLDLTFNYKVNSGLTHAEADALSKFCEKQIGDAYQTRDVMNRLAQDDVLLYLSHYEKQDPFLRTIEPISRTSAPSNRHITSTSIPRVEPGVILDKLQFDLTEVRDNLEGNNASLVYPRATCILINPASGKSSCVSLQAVEIISLCDGRNSLKQIAYELSQRYDAPRNTIEQDCIAILKPLVGEGFINV